MSSWIILNKRLIDKANSNEEDHVVSGDEENESAAKEDLGEIPRQVQISKLLYKHKWDNIALLMQNIRKKIQTDHRGDM